MCGRYASSANAEDLVAEFEIDENGVGELTPSWNVAPTDPVPIVVERHSPERQLRSARWGLVPSWAKDRKIGARMINARSETVAQKPAFSAAAGRRRCLVPADGYFEWQQTDKGKVPWFLHGGDGQLLAFAGLYELWPDPKLPRDDPDRWLLSCTIITAPATDALGHIHDRTPVIVPTELRGDWLDCSTGDPSEAAHLLAQMPEPHLATYVVSTAVNSVRNNGPELVDPVEP